MLQAIVQTMRLYLVMIGCVTSTRQTFVIWVIALVPITCKLTNIVKIEHDVGLGVAAPTVFHIPLFFELVASCAMTLGSVVRKINDFEMLPFACTHEPPC